MVADLGKLVAVRSQLAEGLMAYLQWLIDLPDQNAPPYFQHRRLTDLYVTPLVFRKAAANDPTGGPRLHGGVSLDEERQGKFGTQEEKRTLVSWQRESRTIRRAVILGRPGEGKTLLARTTVRALARASLDDLIAQRRGIAELNIPVLLLLEDVANPARPVKTSSKRLEDAVAAAVGNILKHACPEAPLSFVRPVRDYILSLLFTERCWLFLDALDEVTKPARLPEALSPLRYARCRVVVTSRPYSYDRALLPFSSLIEYELAPLGSYQRQQFVDKWFSHDAAAKGRLIQLVQSNPLFDDLTRHGLLLTITCATAERHSLEAAVRRVEMYRFAVRDMVRQIWKEDATAKDDPAIGGMLRLLRHVAWSLFQRDPARNLFSEDELSQVVRDARESGPGWSEARVLKALRRTGLIVSPAEGRRMFLHRTLLEFLAAEYVAKQTDPLALIEPFLWQPDANGILRWQPAAGEMLCFLAGCLRDPNPLLLRLVHLNQERPDQGRTMLLLAGRCLADADENTVDEALGRSIAKTVLEVAKRSAFYGPLSESDWRPFLAHRWGRAAVSATPMAWKKSQDKTDLEGPAIQLAGHRSVDQLVQDLGDWRVAHTAETALRLLDEERTVDLLIREVKQPTHLRRITAVKALGRFGGEQAVEPLLELLQELREPSPEDRQTKHAAIVALGQLGDERAVLPLIDLLRVKEDTKVAAGALGDLGSDLALGPLVEVLNDPNRYHGSEAAMNLSYIANALSRVNSPRVVEKLLEGIDRWDTPAQRAAAEALGQMGCKGAREPIRRLLQTSDPWLREVAATALCLLDEVGPLLQVLREDDGSLEDVCSERGWNSPCYLARCLGHPGNKRSEEALVQAFLHGNLFVREMTAEAFWNLRCDQAVDLLVHGLKDPESRPHLASTAHLACLAISQKTGRWVPNFPD
jgi:HEAT repeat protein